MTEDNRLGHFGLRELRQWLVEGRLALRTGPFRYQITCGIPGVAEYLRHLYGDFPAEVDPGFCNLQVGFEPVLRWHGPSRSVHHLWAGGELALEEANETHATAHLEWAMNQAILHLEKSRLIFHAACLERDGRGLIITAPSGGGKSTLATALAASGWRLLSDEYTVVDLEDGQILPVCRPVSLKESALDMARAWFPQARFGPVANSAEKGRIGHMAPLPEWLDRIDERVLPSRVIFVDYQAGAETTVTPVLKAGALVDLAGSSGSYGCLGADGFQATADVVERCRSIHLQYSDLDHVLPLIASDDLFA